MTKQQINNFNIVRDRNKRGVVTQWIVDYDISKHFHRKPRLKTYLKGFSRAETLMKILIQMVCMCISEKKCNPDFIWKYPQLV